MKTRVLLAVAAVLAIVGIAALRSTLLRTEREDVPLEGVPVDPQAGGGVAARGPDAANLEPGRSGSEERSSVVSEAVEATPAPPSSALEVVGVCVTVDGLPVGGVRVRVAGTATEPSSELEVRAVCDPDGTFTLAVEERELPSWLCFEADRLVPVRLKIEPDEETPGRIDLGEVVLPEGIYLRGSVVNARGEPLADVQVTTEHLENRYATRFVAEAPSAISSIDGSLDFGWCLPGRYSIRTPEKELLSPSPANFGQPEGVDFLEVVVADEAEMLEIDGVVTDARGLPVEGARVQAAEKEGKRRIVDAEAAGRFVVRRPPGEAKSVQLSAFAPGYDVYILPEEVSWGERSLHLALVEAATIEVRVTRADTGEPVPGYGVRLLRGDGHALAPVKFGARLELEHVGEHPGGVLRIPGVFRGRYRLRVEPTGAGVAAGLFERVVVGERATTVVEVALPASTERLLRVLTSTGAPVPGCRVVTCLHSDDPVDLESDVIEAARWGQVMIPHRALLVQRGETSADGTLRLRGPAATELVIRVEGPGCLPEVFVVERLDGKGTLELVASASGVVRVTVQQPEILTELARVLSSPPSIRLTELGVESRRGRKSLPAVVLSAEPPIAMLDAPAGAWEPMLELGDDELVLAPVQVVLGSVTDVPLDLRELEPATIRGRVLRGGEPLSFAKCFLRRWGPAPRTEGMRWNLIYVTTDAAGRFTHAGLPGRYRLMAPRASDSIAGICAAPGTIDVAPGEELEQDFEALTGELRLRLLDGEGEPVAGVAGLEVLRSIDDDVIEELGPTDADGCVVCRECEPGTVFVRALPRRLGERRARIELLRETRDLGAIDRERIPLGSLTVTPGEVTEMDLVLPKAYFE